jgi:exonuclease VII large subunit
MQNNISELLKAATKDILTEDVLKEIESAYEASVDAKVQLHVEKALNEQDEDYASKLETLLEAVDADHTNKLKKVVEALDADRARKLKQIVGKYEIALTTEAANFKNEMIDQVSNYLELYLEDKLPTAELQEAVNNKRAASVLNEMRNMLSVDMALAQESIRDAVVDGKTRIDEAASQLETANKRIATLTEQLNTVNASLTLEKKISSLDEDKKKYMKKMLGSKSAKFIAENFDYTLGLYEKSEEERFNNLVTEAREETVTTAVDRPVIEESIETPASEDRTFNLYLNELHKY